MKNKLNIILAIFWLVIAIFFSWLLISRLSGNGSILFNSKTADRVFGTGGITFSLEDLSLGDINTLYKSYSFSASDVEHFNIELVSASVHFVQDSESDITVGLYGNWNSDIEPEVKLERSKLNIKTPNITFKNKTGIGSRKIIISIPESAISTLFDADVSSVSGSVHVTDVSFRELDVDTTSGSVHINGYVDVLSANTVSGSIHVNGTCKNLNCDTISGSIHIETDEPLTGKNNCSTVSGSVHITIPEDCGFEFEWETISGSVNNAFYNGKCGKSGSQIIGDGRTKIDVETISGSIHLNKN